MTSKAMKKKIKERCESLERKFEKKFEKMPDISGRKCFKAREDEVKRNLFEDGDLFYMDEMDEEQMFNKMIEEISA